MALTDTLDDLITIRSIEPQLAIKILANFDRSITEILADKVKARLQFKVSKEIFFREKKSQGDLNIWLTFLLYLS